MPVVLNKNEEKLWLGLDGSVNTRLLDPFPADKMEMYPVSTLVNKPINDNVKVTQKNTTL
jgi:putative SOS response-associated peptidase YedK